MTDLVQHPHLVAYLDALRSRGKASTARTYGEHLRRLETWLAGERTSVGRATTDDLARFQAWIAVGYRTARGEPLGRGTQAVVTSVVRAAYAWMRRRLLIVHDPAARLVVPKVPATLAVAKEHLLQQECIALFETLVARVDEARPGTTEHALRQRDLALVALAIASGRRSSGLTGMRLDQLDLARNEVRVEVEKGKTGRVLPVAPWATAAVRRYIEDGRARLLRGGGSDRLFVSQRRGAVCHKAFEHLLRAAVTETVRRNPDLAELAAKRISTHSLRVTFSTRAYAGGADIRVLNELMLHASLNTTARYTPVGLDDLRRALVGAHPRA